MKGRILSGMRPTGKLHLGHLSVLENWVNLQKEYECYFFIADWHALTTSYDNTSGMKDFTRELVLDWLSVGIDPEKSVVFVQSDVKAHAELHLLLSMTTPLSWLERCPTFKDQVEQLGKEGKDINTYGFLGYPLLMASDILMYQADTVPVGKDQIPHLELTREVARRFNFMYNTEVFPEPDALLAEVPLLPGVDGRKMSKSYHNDIAINATTAEIKNQVKMMVTDPARIKKDDPGHPEVCIVHTYHTFYNKGEVLEIEQACREGNIGCVACKNNLAVKLDALITPFREKRVELEKNPEKIESILVDGAKRARVRAEATMKLVRDAVGLR